jgi:Fe-Mn family superoxide dismutase
MHTLPELPYQSLAPHISDETLSYHYGKHHKAYVDNLNRFLSEDYEGLSLEDVISKSYREKNVPIFNNAAQIWNHAFYWYCMKPNGGGMPSHDFLSLIRRDFGSFEAMFSEFHQAALSQFGSGWAWLILENEKLKIIKTGNAETPLVENVKVLLTCDVWEHSYYLDYQNRRGDYITIFLEKLVNWDFVESNVTNKFRI